jgi:predicted Zn-dependent peptidase
LPNGLVTVVVPRHELQRAHLALYVRVGSRFETKETNGLSHFLEHMLYRGTPRLPSAHQVNLAFERLGGFLYAATHTDFGVFSVTLPPESMDEASAHFGELLREPLFADIEIEKGIVCEEILEDLDDEGRQVDADNISRALIYPTHPLGFTITGDETRVRSFDDAMLRAHHARHYVAKSSVLVYSGPVDEAEALAMGARDFSWMPAGERLLGGVPEHTQKKPRYKRVENSSSQTELRVCLRAPSEQSAERPVIEMLMRILDDGMSTRLYHRICDAGGLCYDVSAGYDGYEDDGIVDFAAGVLHQRAPQVTREILKMLEELGETGPTEDEMEKARRRLSWDTRAMLDSAEELAGVYAGGYLFGRFETAAQRLEANLAVTAGQVRDLVRSISRPENLNVVAVGLVEGDAAKRLADDVRGWKGLPG